MEVALSVMMIGLKLSTPRTPTAPSMKKANVRFAALSTVILALSVAAGDFIRGIAVI